jgi:hypothetical protein
MFECRYGNDTCLCNGGSWYCATPSCEAKPSGDLLGGGCVWPGHYTCEYPNQDQNCTCADNGGGRRCSCPVSAPTEGATCLGRVGPEGNGCEYGNKFCDCVDGLWRCSPCPITQPTTGASCSSPAANCTYPYGLCYCDGTSWTCS